MITKSRLRNNLIVFLNNKGKKFRPFVKVLKDLSLGEDLPMV
jgi:hypothetical protein